MKTGTGKRRFMAAVLCFATLFAMVLGSAGVKPITAKADDELTVNSTLGNSVTYSQNPILEVSPDEKKPFTFTSSGASIDTADQKVSFTSAGKVTITVTDAESKTGNITFNVAPEIQTTGFTNDAIVESTYTSENKLEANAGSSSVTWGIKNNSPSWLSINTENKITGTPPSGTNSPVQFTITATVGNGADAVTAETELSLIVKTPPTITTESPLEDGVVGVDYSATLNATGDDTITWSVESGSLPPGLNLSDPTTGKSITISGKPTTENNYTFTLKADNGVGTAGTKEFTIKVNAAPKKASITSPAEGTALTAGTVGTAYEYNGFTATGDETITWSATGLPAGLTMSSDGKISGTPAAITASAATVKVTAKNNAGSDTKEYSLIIKTAKPVTGITIDPTSITIPVGGTYTYNALNFIPTDATVKTVKWTTGDASIATVNEGTGMITGVKAGSTTITATAQDGSGTEGTMSVTVSANSPKIKTDAKLKEATIGEEYAVTLEANKPVSSETLTWMLVENTFPSADNVKLDTSTGKLTLKPTKAGTYTARIRVTSASGSDERTFTLVVSSVSVDAVIKTNDDGIKGVLESDSLKEFADTQKDSSGNPVNVELEVVATKSATASNSAQSSLSERIKRLFSGVKTGNYETHFLEIDITTIKGSTETEISDTKTAIEVPIQVDFKNVKRTPVVFRYHGNSIQELTALSARPTGSLTDATFYYKDDMLYIYSRYFSSYVVAYPTVDTYTVSFNTNGGSTIDPVFVERGGTITAPTSPTRSGYTFGGWFTDSALTQSWNSSTAINADTTLYARWTSSTNGGTNTSGSGTATAAEGGRGVSSPQTSDRMWALWGVILFIVILNGVYIALAARKGRNRE